MRLAAEQALDEWESTKGTWPKTEIYELEALVCFADNRRHDLDNTLKSVSDAINEVVYDDDKRIKSIRAVSLVDKENPRVQVRLTVISQDDIDAWASSRWPSKS